VSFYYYLKVLKQIYVVNGTDRKDATNVSWFAQVVLLVMAILVILLGCFPNLLVGGLQACLASSG
jgi:NADH:ubiquinone oxidoreductase subunit 2 (subunit N)